MSAKTITELKEQAEQKFAELEIPAFNYGRGFALNIAVDWKKVFTEMQRAEDAEIIADERIKIRKLSESGEEFISRYAQKLVSPAENKILALHHTAAADAAVIIIPKNTILENPIIINTKAAVAASAESIIVIVEEGASAAIVENTTSTADARYKSQVVQLYLQPKAKMNYCAVHNGEKGIYSFTTKRAEVLQDANINWIDFVIGDGVTQVQLRSHLRGSGAEAQQYQAMVGTEEQQSDINSDVFHQHQNTTSTMLARGILADKARAMYRGTIRIEKNAPGCSGHQRCDMLLVGEEARCNAIPVLEVENDDVSCSHGTTMGQIDEEQLYYLLSRGIDEKKAKQLMIAGFIEPILQKISNEKTREELLTIIRQKLEK